MVGNWWEERQDRKDSAGTPRRTTERVFPSTQPGNDYTTSKSAADQSMLSGAPVQRPKRASMYPDSQALVQAIDTYMPGGQPPADLTYTLGPNAVTADAGLSERHLGTTTKYFYSVLPHQARTTRPDMFSQTVDKTHFAKGTLTRELKSSKHIDDTIADTSLGGKGGRGEVTRNPAEAGNPYGVSVFVDEYSKWGTKIAGMTYGETVSRKMTSYF
eukprot:CAMPEP_0119108836 /NCGR_PEP_ID=MMETSP1180-20130426/15706_1 /TAXON_ID=3052 ORGANISM="Chlamydomonas cf sp, Strain CCMP681" /NCGR_SAMPLE_ID=MMETSP1180 /ASSEMBLY_ACC=CAM_ASM_000741 /LENGTH=214 /DNA_ID=CAMNT_0007094499 /DNA_START=141 /DNA_END=785 /DNA_ORIENTATION=+